jgi:asparagine synthase (glutamine-hydrolysing)
VTARSRRQEFIACYNGAVPYSGGLVYLDEERSCVVAGGCCGIFAGASSHTGGNEACRTPFIGGDVIVACTGHVDNAEEIARALGSPDLGGRSDAEVLAAAYSRWGERFPAHVVGHYSCVVFDRERGSLVAVRGDLGVEPLFRVVRHGVVWIASSLDLLLAVHSTRPPLEDGGLADYVASGGLINSGRTVYAEIDQVPPHHVLVFDGTRTKERCYWAPDASAASHVRSLDDTAAYLQSLLREAVRPAVRASSPAWSDLSGGLDSSTVTAFAALLCQAGEASGGTVEAFSLTASETKASDEGRFQHDFLGMYPLPRHWLDMDRYVRYSDEGPTFCHPSRAILDRPLWGEANRLFDVNSVGVHLTGLGGDAVFCGDGFPPLYLSELVRARRWRDWLREIRKWSSVGDRSLWNLMRHCSGTVLTDTYAGAPQGSAPLWLRTPFRDAVRGHDEGRWRSGNRVFESPARELQWRSIAQLASTERFLRVGNEWHPLLYRPLVEFMLSVPWPYLIGPTMNRVVHREATKLILPDSIRLRKSKGDGMPLYMRSVRVNWPRIERLLLRSRLADMGLVEPSLFKTAIERLRHGVLAKHFRYFAGVLSLEIWLQSKDSRGLAVGDSLRPLVRLRDVMQEDHRDAHVVRSLRTANV